MKIAQVFHEKSIKPKPNSFGGWLLNGKISIEALPAYPNYLNSSDKVTGIEAFELATKISKISGRME